MPNQQHAPTPFVQRHLGPRPAEIEHMLHALQLASLEELTARTVPASIRMEAPLQVPPAASETEVMQELADLAARNQVFRSFIGMGYHDCVTPAIIQRNILENPGWYTAYTPYQAEISQGRMEALLNFQTLVTDLTALPVANSSLLDEGTAAAEAMTLCRRALGRSGEARDVLLVDGGCHPQTIAVVRTRAEPLGIDVQVGDWRTFQFSERVFAALVQYPDTSGAVHDYAALCQQAHAAGALVIAATDLLALTLLKPPGEWGADVAVGSAQRLGVPLGFGGPHPAFMATREDHKRHLPGRIIGVSRDANGQPAMRLALQTREQHIRREKATSNLCTAQVLLAVTASMYAVYHGPRGLHSIAARMHAQAAHLAAALETMGCELHAADFFDTLRVRPQLRTVAKVLAAARSHGVNLRDFGDGTVGIALDETVTEADLHSVVQAFGGGAANFDEAAASEPAALPTELQRTSEYMQHPVFTRYHSETELLRYIHRLQSKDLSLTTAMIPLGSCTMKLNATAEMAAISWPGFARLHPFAPADQTQGYTEMFSRLEEWLQAVTGFAAVSLQPNAGSQGEYAGLLVIRAYHHARGDLHRNVCLIPSSAHGTNPASATMAGMEVVVVACDADGNVDLADLRAKATLHSANLAALMVTYPSTHGVFEESIRDICAVAHEHGAQVYMDGANMNAQVGVCQPGEIGADVCHLNLPKTFAIPHGGGGPGMGPICVAEHLAPFLPGHPAATVGGAEAVGPVSAAPWGSALVLTISYAYIRLLGADGMRAATQVALLNANYIAQRLHGHYEVLYRGSNGLVAHECILDTRPLKVSAGVEAMDIAKRLMDYGFHAPTVSFPVAGTLMVEPTESESLAEIDRFCDAMIAVRDEIREIEQGRADRENNPLKRAPHPPQDVCADVWDRPYSRMQAAYPAPWSYVHKYWPPIARIDDVFGDRNLVCTCLPIEAYAAVDAA